jgi:hypothetical protein
MFPEEDEPRVGGQWRFTPRWAAGGDWSLVAIHDEDFLLEVSFMIKQYFVIEGLVIPKPGQG